MTLPDGRVLAYAQVGALDGPPVLYFHGAPTSRLDLAYYDDALVARGVRAIAPDRPGYGGSTPHPGRGLDDWPADVLALADHLGLARFAVLGYSSGGPYAVVCGSRLAGRVTAAAVVAGVSDMGWAAAWDGFAEPEATLMRLGDEAAVKAACDDRYGADGSRYFDDGAAELAPADVETMADEALAAAGVRTVGEAFRQGTIGYAQDIVAQARPWPFDPASITVPTTVVHGGADTVVPVAHGRHTADVIPAASFVVHPDHGHLSIATELPDILASLATPASG